MSQAGCSGERLLNSLCFRSPVLIVGMLLRVTGNLRSPVLAQQGVDDFCMALQCSMDQCTLTILISVSHLAQKGHREGMNQHCSGTAAVVLPAEIGSVCVVLLLESIL